MHFCTPALIFNITPSNIHHYLYFFSSYFLPSLIPFILIFHTSFIPSTCLSLVCLFLCEVVFICFREVCVRFLVCLFCSSISSLSPSFLPSFYFPPLFLSSFLTPYHNFSSSLLYLYTCSLKFLFIYLFHFPSSFIYTG